MMFLQVEKVCGGSGLAVLPSTSSGRHRSLFWMVDAALDATNVARVAHYIRTCTRPTAAAAGASGDSKRQQEGCLPWWGGQATEDEEAGGGGAADSSLESFKASSSA